MDVVDRLTPSSDIKTTLTGLQMPITAAIVFQVFFIILNLIDGEDDSFSILGLHNSVGFVLMAVLLAIVAGLNLYALWPSDLDVRRVIITEEPLEEPVPEQEEVTPADQA